MTRWGEIKCPNCAALEERLKAALQDADEAEAYAEELEAKLKRAVEDLQDMLTIPNSEAAQGILKAYARALIAELKGQDDE